MTSATARANARLRTATRPPISLTISTPAYSGLVTTDYCRALFGTIHLLGREGIPVTWHDLGGASLVPRARSMLVAEFLASPDASLLLFVDADVAWNPLDVLRLIEHRLDIVCGVYPMKSDELRFPASPIIAADGTAVVCPGRAASRWTSPRLASC